MTKSRCLVVRLSLYLLTVCPFLLTVGCGQVQEISYTANFGGYALDGADALQNFNSQAREWFIERGFVEIEDVAFSDIADPGHGEWDKPGILLLFIESASPNLFYVFIPDSYHTEDYHPEKRIQYIGFHVALKGSAKEVKDYHDDFRKLRYDFLKAAPTF